MSRRKRRKTLPGGAVIRMLVASNPKRSHGAAYCRFEQYRDGMTADEFRQAVGYQKQMTIYGTTRIMDSSA